MITMGHSWNGRDEKTKVLGEKLFLVPLYPPQITCCSILHVLKWLIICSLKVNIFLLLQGL
jgi:hypothetical protein